MVRMSDPKDPFPSTMDEDDEKIRKAEELRIAKIKQDTIDEMMSRRPFQPEEIGMTPTLAETPAEAQRMLYAGRQSVSLRESRVFDAERLNNSPLFERRLF
jgi:hypothetical protein